jgi:small-conductance mechanosensitive channel
MIIISSILQINSVALAQSDIEPDVNYSKAFVNFDGYDLFSVRGNSSINAQERANAISKRIELIAMNYSISPESIIVKPNISDYDEILLNDEVILRVFDSDASKEGVSRGTFSFGARVRIIKAIHTYRYERSYDALLNNLLYSAGAIAVCFILLFIIRFIMKKINLLIENRLKTKFETLESRSFQLIRSNQILITISGLTKSIKFFLMLAILFTTSQYILGLFPWTRFISVSLVQIFIKPFGDFGLALLNFIPSLAFLIVIFFITKYVLKLFKLLFLGLKQGSITITGFDPDWAVTTYKIVRLLIIAFAVIVAYPYIPGSDSDAFKGVSLFIGVLFSLGSSSVIGNLIAGYTMTYRKTFKIGDVVQIDNNTGQVADIKLFVTRLLTAKNEEIIIPNSIILNTQVVNYSTLARDKGLILHTTVGIGYETPWRQVEGMLLLAAERTEELLKDPKPFVLQKSLGDFAINYELNVYTSNPSERLKTYTALHKNILDVFNENNIQIMTPAYEGDPEEPKVVPKKDWFTPVAGAQKKE